MFLRAFRCIRRRRRGSGKRSVPDDTIVLHRLPPARPLAARLPRWFAVALLLLLVMRLVIQVSVLSLEGHGAAAIIGLAAFATFLLGAWAYEFHAVSVTTLTLWDGALVLKTPLTTKVIASPGTTQRLVHAPVRILGQRAREQYLLVDERGRITGRLWASQWAGADLEQVWEGLGLRVETMDVPFTPRQAVGADDGSAGWS